MRKNGFTLIELLAVIVILAIIALIATPIILGIINDAREKANERSVELYASAVRNGIAAYQLTGTSAPKSFSDLTIQYDGDVKCSVQELYSDGSFYLEGCKVNNGDKEYSYGTKQEKIVKLSDVCTIASDSEVQGLNMGAKYNCKVDPNKEYYDFYILSTGETEVNLIMSTAINADGTAATSTYENVAWLSQDDYEKLGGKVTEEMKNDEMYCQYANQCINNSYGPITAMNFLEQATSNWTNLSKIEVNTLTKKYNVYARMPFDSEKNDIISINSWSFDSGSMYCYGHVILGTSGIVDNFIGYADFPIQPVITLSI